MNHKNPLVVSTMAEKFGIARPDSDSPLTEDSPAIHVLIDFTLSDPPMLEGKTPVDEAQDLMHREHASFKLVIDNDERFRGIITRIDLMSSKLLRVANSLGRSREDLCVQDVMIPISALHSIDIDYLANASVGRVLDWLRRFGESHLLVMDSQPKRLRGVVCARDIGRRLAVPERIVERANSFAGIYSALHS